MSRINVTEAFLPPYEEFEKYLKDLWQSHNLTNQGPLLHKLESQLEEYLGLSNLHVMTNGTIALQVALQALGITEGEVITTPFSYVATVSSILWQRCTPVFVDIEPDTYCIDASKIEAAITPRTKAIMAVHVFGNPCDVDKIEAIASTHKLKVIYDGAHAFGVEYKGKSLLEYGDITMCSFHATKLFHTIEGGCLVVKDKNVSDRVELIKRFGHTGNDHYMLGINAKASEFQAAMGLSILPYVDQIIEKRQVVSEHYNKLLSNKLRRLVTQEDVKPNYSYYPVLLESEDQLLSKLDDFNSINVYPRRYFYPSLNRLPYIENHQNCPVSEDIANRILCLPLYSDLASEDIERICEILN
jgi:dTDP-4-amino-4,6-dideoxygalactose transaminase